VREIERFSKNQKAKQLKQEKDDSEKAKVKDEEGLLPSTITPIQTMSSSSLSLMIDENETSNNATSSSSSSNTSHIEMNWKVSI